MTDIKKKLDELKADLNRIQTAQQTETDPDKLCSLSVEARHIKQQIATFDKLAAAEQQKQHTAPVAPKEAYTAFIRQHHAAHQSKVQAIKDEITANLTAQQEQQEIYNRCTAAVDVAGSLGASEELERLTEKKRHLDALLTATAALPVYDSTDLDEEWHRIQTEAAPHYNSRLDAVKLAAEAYRHAVADLREYNDLLLRVRNTYQQEAQQHGKPFDPRPHVLSRRLSIMGKEFDRLRIRDNDSAPLLWCGDPTRHEPL